MQFHVNYLHGGKYVYYTTHEHVELNNLFRGMFADPTVADAEFAAANVLLDYAPQFISNIKHHFYTMWPINVELHWVAVILHVVPAADGKSFEVNAVIADPERNPNTMSFVWKRLQRILSPARGFTLQPAPQALWYPKQVDGYSCGLRVYEIMKTILARINEVELRMLPNGFWDRMWDDLSCDFQPDKVRAEMIGIVATEALRELRWEGRLAIAPCSEVSDGVGHGPTRVLAQGRQGWLSHYPDRPSVEFSNEVQSHRNANLGGAQTTLTTLPGGPNVGVPRVSMPNVSIPSRMNPGFNASASTPAPTVLGGGTLGKKDATNMPAAKTLTRRESDMSTPEAHVSSEAVANTPQGSRRSSGSSSSSSRKSGRNGVRKTRASRRSSSSSSSSSTVVDLCDEEICLADVSILNDEQIWRRVQTAGPPSKRWAKRAQREADMSASSSSAASSCSPLSSAFSTSSSSSSSSAAACRRSTLRSAARKWDQLYNLG